VIWNFDRDRGLIIVPAEVSGPRGAVAVRLVLDTGAAATVISPYHLMFAGHHPEHSPERIELTTASGVEFVPRIAVQALSALGQRRQNLAVVSHTLPPSTAADGVLGLDFFRDHRLIVDFREGVLSLD